MGQAVTTKAVNNSQFSERFPNRAIFVYGSYDAGVEKTVEIREETNADLEAFLATYTYNSDFGRDTQDTTLRDDLRAQLDAIDANLTNNWSGLDAAGRIAALRAAAILSVRIARFILRRLL